MDDEVELEDVSEEVSNQPGSDFPLSNREAKKKTSAPKRAQYTVIR